MLEFFIDGELKPQYVAHTNITEYSYVVPKGKKWLLIGGRVRRPTTCTLVMYITDPDDHDVLLIIDCFSGDVDAWYPAVATGKTNINAVFPLVLEEGWSIKIVWSVEQASTSTTCCVLEVDA